MPREMSANYAASLSLLILHSCQLNLSDKAAVSSSAFQSLSASHWPPQVCLITVCLSISLCRSPRHSLSALFCPHEFAQAHRSTRHALSSPLPVKILPIPQGLHCVLWYPRLPSFIPSTPSGICLLFLEHAPNLLGCKNKQANKETWAHAHLLQSLQSLSILLGIRSAQDVNTEYIHLVFRAYFPSV